RRLAGRCGVEIEERDLVRFTRARLELLVQRRHLHEERRTLAGAQQVVEQGLVLQPFKTPVGGERRAVDVLRLQREQVQQPDHVAAARAVGVACEQGARFQQAADGAQVYVL